MDIHYRELAFDRKKKNEKHRSVEASLSSEELVLREFGFERLRHSEDGLDMSRARNGLSLLMNHDPNIVIGRAENIRLDDRRLRATLRFADTERGNEAWQLVRGGFMDGVSVGYVIQRMDRVGEQDGHPIIEATRWMPVEVSATPVPADASVGVGRGRMQKRGESLAAFLNEQIDQQESDDNPRGDIIESMGSAAGISASTVNQILNASIDCPPLERLEGFAEALGISVESIIEAAERDGCEYGDDEDEDDSRIHRPPCKRQEKTVTKEVQTRSTRKNEAPTEPQITAETHERAKKEAAEAERSRIAEIQRIAGSYPKLAEAAQEFIGQGKSVEEFRKLALERLTEDGSKPTNIAEPGTPETQLGLSRKEVKRFSLFRVLRAQAAALEGAPEQRLWKECGFELECSRSLAEKLNIEPRGILVPWDVQAHGDWGQPSARSNDAIYRAVLDALQQRAAPMDTSENSDIVATNLLAGRFIEALRARTVVMMAGAQTLTGLVGNIDIPGTDAVSTFEWLAEDGEPTDKEVTTRTVSLTPKTVAGAVPITRRLLLQSTPDAETIVRRDIVDGAAVEIDKQSLVGDGTSNKPTGVRSATGINTVTISSAGDPTWAEAVKFETEVASDDALGLGAAVFITTPAVRGNMKVKAKDAGSGRFVAENNEVNGYPLMVTTSMPANGITFGNFNQVLIGFWSTLDVVLDRATKIKSGGLVIRAFQDLDIAVRHAVAFAKEA